MFNTKLYWKIWIIIGIVIFFVTLLIKGFSFDLGLIMSAISAGGATLLIETLLFKKFIWKKKPDLFYPWLCSVPHIGGIWEGLLLSDYIYPETQQKGDPIPARLEIKHEFDCLKVTLETNQSSSNSYVSDIWTDGAGRKYLCYTYYNSADQDRDSNPNHEGTAKLRISKDDFENLILEGHYFTGRGTTGKMTFKRINHNNTQI